MIDFTQLLQSPSFMLPASTRALALQSEARQWQAMQASLDEIHKDLHTIVDIGLFQADVLYTLSQGQINVIKSLDGIGKFFDQLM